MTFPKTPQSLVYHMVLSYLSSKRAGGGLSVPISPPGPGRVVGLRVRLLMGTTPRLAGQRAIKWWSRKAGQRARVATGTLLQRYVPHYLYI